ncbi:MAG: hypothetical protein ACRBDL_10140 [Alphaproteobacteria bacterium]
MARKTTKIELNETLICNTIDEHANGTFSLIGLYPKDIAVTQAPANLVVSLWLNFIGHIAEPMTLEVKLSGKNVLEEDYTVDIELSPTESLIAIPVILKNITLPLISIGSLEISYKTPKSKWKVARTVHLEIAEAARN